MTDTTDTVDTSRYRIERLNPNNYYLWSKKIELVLRGKGLWGIVSGEELPPTVGEAEEVTRSFQRRKDIALSDILLTIEDSSSAAVLDLRDPRTVWNELKNIYQAISEASIDSLLVQYQGMRMKTNETVSQYANRLVQVENKLAAIGRAVPKDERKRALLRGLPSNYQVIAQVIRAMDKNVTEAIGMLITHEMTFRSETVSNEDKGVSTALVTNHPRDKKCFHCGRKGHEKKDCFHNPESPKYIHDKQRHFTDREGHKQKGFKRREGHRGPPHNTEASKGTRSNQRKGGGSYITFLTKCLTSTSTRQPTIRENWFIDSGATSHMCNRKESFANLSLKDDMPAVSVGDGSQTNVVGVGNVLCSTRFGTQHKSICLERTLYIPDLMCNLLSVSRMRQAGLHVVFRNNHQGKGVCTITKPDTDEPVLKGFERDDGLYEVSCLTIERSYEACNLSTSPVEMSQLWHARLGHASGGVISKTIRMVDGIDINSVKLQSCDSCLKGKSIRDVRTSTTFEQSTQPLELMHADIIGPVRTPSLNGSRYCISLYDDYSGLSLLRFTKTKNAAAEALKEMILELERALQNHTCPQKVARLRTDNAKEFLSESFEDWLKAKGIHHELSSPYSPESNGKAERLNRTLMDMARTMMISISHLRNYEELWAEAMHTANYLRNRMFSSACSVHGKTPFEVILHRKPNLSHLKRFGAIAYVHIPKERRRGKFEARAEVGIHVGFDRGNSYKVWIPHRETVITSRDVSFDELSPPDSHETASHQGDPDVVDLEHPMNFETNNNLGKETDPEKYFDAAQESHLPLSTTASNEGVDDIQELVTHYPTQTRSGRVVKQTQRYSNISGIVLSVRCGNEKPTTPTTYREAMNTINKLEWQKAMQEEINQLNTNQTWTLEPLPSGAKAVKNRWVYAVKTDSAKNVTRHRARLVAKGFTQQAGIDYGETYAPVAKYSTLRFLLALAASEELELLQLDVKAAFLNGTLDEVIYMTQPEGFVHPDHKDWVYRLQKALYGLKQASRAWHRVIDSLLKSLQITRSESDPSLYIRVDNFGTMYVLVYVDDMLLCGHSKDQLSTTATRINAEVEIRMEKDVSKFLGILITRNRKLGTLKIHSTFLIDEALEKFGMTNAKEQNIPISPGTILDQPNMLGDRDEGQYPRMQFVPYKELVGTLLHLANTTRPDIAFSVSLLSRFMQDPRHNHWQAAKNVLRYLKLTRTAGIVYQKQLENTAKVHGYTDSDFAADRMERKSVSGYIFISGGGAVSWRSKKQSVVAQSTVEAEYIAMSFAVREAVWLQRINKEFKDVKTKPFEILLYADNQGAMEIARNDVCNERSKHIDVKFHFLREHIRNGTVKLQYIRTDKMVADIMTKLLPFKKHNYFMTAMGMNDETSVTQKHI